MVVDGRQVGYSIGTDLLPLQETLLAEGCHNAAMMDGGSSTVMIYNKEFVNRPSLGFERYINNCWVVLPAKETEQETEE
jgi:exopolysaccharide biosynthesis protein